MRVTVRNESEPIERPFRWRDLWRVFVPLFPWIGIALVIYVVVRVLR